MANAHWVKIILMNCHRWREHPDINLFAKSRAAGAISQSCHVLAIWGRLPKLNPGIFHQSHHQHALWSWVTPSLLTSQGLTSAGEENKDFSLKDSQKVKQRHTYKQVAYCGPVRRLCWMNLASISGPQNHWPRGHHHLKSHGISQEMKIWTQIPTCVSASDPRLGIHRFLLFKTKSH